MFGFIDAAGAYYEGDRQGDDIPVPLRPSVNHRWIEDAWTLPARVVWDPVRDQRAPRLIEADVQLNKAQDRDNATLVAAIRQYREALRDITMGGDPTNVTWPTAPWQEK